MDAERLSHLKKEFEISADDEKRLEKLKNQRTRLYKEVTEDWTRNHGTHLSQLSRLDALIAPIQLKIDENDRKKRLEEQSIRSQTELLIRTIEAVKQVAVTHQELARALEEDRQLSARNLQAAALEIAWTIEAIEKIKEKQDD